MKYLAANAGAGASSAAISKGIQRRIVTSPLFPELDQKSGKVESC
jgi:hypothetical protein